MSVVPAGMRFLFGFLVAAAVVAFGFGTTAAEVLEVKADSINMSAGGAVLDARGSVRAKTGATVVTCDRLTYDRRTRSLRAEGSVLAVQDGKEFRTEYLETELEGRTASTGKGTFVRSPDFLRVQADGFTATGSRITLAECSVTTCKGQVPDWSIMSSTAWTPPSGLLRAWGSTFRIRDVPVLYAPFLAYPLTNIRRSGFLIPFLGYGERDGFRYFQPVYWLIGPDKDATATLEYRSDRAWGGALEYRMLFGDRGGLQARVHVIDDWSESTTFIASGLNADYRIPGGVRAFFRGTHLTEPSFYREFSRSFEDRISRYLESAGEISGGTGSTRGRLVGRFLQNLDGNSDDLPVRLAAEADTYVFPGIGFPQSGSLSLVLSSGVEARMRSDGESVYSARLLPKMALPFRSGAFSGAFFLDGYAEAFTLDGDSGADDVAVAGGAAFEVGTRLARNYGAWAHVMEPRFRYDHRARGGEFAEDLETERSFSAERLVSGRLFNRIFYGGQQFGVIEVGGGLDLGRDERRWEPLRVIGMVQKPVALVLETRFDPNERRIELWSSAVKIPFPQGYFSVGHRYDRTDSDAESTTATVVELSSMLGRSIYTTERLWYDTKGGGVREILVQASWVRACWGVGVSFVHQLDEDRVLASIYLKGLGSLGSADLFPPLP